MPVPVLAGTLGLAALTNDAIKVTNVADAEALAKAWAALARDPAKIDFEKVDVAEKPSYRIPDGISRDARLGFHVSVALREEAAQIRAFTTALERWKGAHAAKNLHAEAGQHGELVIAAREARAAALRAADAAGERRASALQALAQLDGAEIERRWTAMRTAERSATPPAEVVSALGLGPDTARTLSRRLDGLDGDAASRGRALSHARERADADKALASALREVWLPWPPPPDLAALEDLQALANALDTAAISPSPGPAPRHAHAWPLLIIAGGIVLGAVLLALRRRPNASKPAA